MSDRVKEHIEELQDALWPYSTGDDYQLCFTLPKALTNDKTIAELTANKSITKIGSIEAGDGLTVVLPDGSEKTIDKGFQHFNSSASETSHDK